MPPQAPIGGGDQRPATWEDLIAFEAKKAKVPSKLAIEVARQESLFNPAAVSPKGARGLFQLLPATAQELGVDPDDPQQNIRGGVTYLRQQLDRYNGDVPKALAAYNFGPGNVDAGKPYPEETRQYIYKITRGLGQPVQTASFQPASTRVGQPPPPNPPPEPSFSESLLSGFDLSTRAGRRNLMGAVGAISGPLIASGYGAPVGIPLAAAGVIGAMTFGGAQEAWESLTESMVGAPPPEGYAKTATERIPNAMWEQGAYEFLGQQFMWPLKAAGRRLLATSVGKQASAALSRSKQAVTHQFGEALDVAARTLKEAKRAASAAMESTRAGLDARLRPAQAAGERTIAGVRQTARQARGVAAEGVRQTQADVAATVERARATGEAGISAAEQEAAGRTAAIRERFGRIGAPPPPSAAGRQAQAIIEGPAQTARDEVGQMVEEAAQAGPPVNITALKDEARRIFTEEIRPSAQAFPRQALEPIQTGGATLTNMRMDTPAARAQAEAVQKAMLQAQEEQAQTLLKHPAMATLGRILNAEDEVPFFAAHQFKRELDEAVGAAWDQSVRKQVTNITKHLRGTLRQSLSGFAPYDSATAAYQAIAPLYTKGLAPRLRRLAVSDPGAVVHLLSPRRPEEARMLRDLLVAQPAKVGERPAGQAAWDSVRSAWTYERLIKSAKLGNLEMAIGKLDPDFDAVIFGDGVGTQIKENLIQIDRAFNQANASGDALIEAAKQAATHGVATARRQGAAALRTARGVARQTGEMGRQAVEAAKATGRAEVRGIREAGAQALRGVRAQGRAAVRTAEEELAGTQVAREVALTPIESQQQALMYSRLGAAPPLGGYLPWRYGLIARLLYSPRSADLVRWAAYSNRNTQRWVTAATSPYPGMALSDLLRSLDVSGVIDLPSQIEGTLEPKPPASPAGASRVAQAPPPGP